MFFEDISAFVAVVRAEAVLAKLPLMPVWLNPIVVNI